jgi:hypothetical protein
MIERGGRERERETRERETRRDARETKETKETKETRRNGREEERKKPQKEKFRNIPSPSALPENEIAKLLVSTVAQSDLLLGFYPKRV